MLYPPLVVSELFSAGIFAVGLLALYGSVNEFRRRRVMRDTPTSKARSLAMGNVEVKRVAEPDGETFEAPFSDTDCVMYTYGVEVYESGGQNSSPGWESVEAGVKAPPFYLNDGTGRVLVDPDGAQKELPVENVYEYGEGDEESEAVRGFMSEREELFAESSEDLGISELAEFATSTDLRVGDSDLVGSDTKRRYKESIVPVDSEEGLYVFGEAMPREGVSSPDNPENIVISRTEETPMFRISGSSEKDNISGTQNRMYAGAVFGFLFAVGGFAAMIHTAGKVLGVLLAGAAAYGAYRFNERFTLNKDSDRTS